MWKSIRVTVCVVLSVVVSGGALFAQGKPVVDLNLARVTAGFALSGGEEQWQNTGAGLSPLIAVRVVDGLKIFLEGTAECSVAGLKVMTGGGAGLGWEFYLLDNLTIEPYAMARYGAYWDGLWDAPRTYLGADVRCRANWLITPDFRLTAGTGIGYTSVAAGKTTAPAREFYRIYPELGLTFAF